MFTVASARADTYSWTNFQSDIPGVAQHVDPNLVNPWGMAASSLELARFGSATTALVSRHSTVRMAQHVPLVVEIPTAARNRGGGNPTGIVSNTTRSSR